MKKIEWVSILRGIGIISVVIGHSCSSIFSRFVYSYHLALFFFVSGFLYNENKYGMNPYMNIANRLKNSYGKYVLYATMLVIPNALWVRMHIVSQEWASFSFYDFRNYFLNTLVLTNTNPLFGPAWFVLALICGMGLAGVIIYAGNIAYKIVNKMWIKHVVIIILTIIFSIMGMERFSLGFQLYARLDVGMFVLPIIILGYYCRQYSELLGKSICFPGTLVCMSILCYCVYKLGWTIDLCGQCAIMYQYLLLSVCGIYVMIFLSKIISKTRFLSKVFTYMGNYSFEIMCFHFICFKGVDFIYSKIIKDTNNIDLAAIPHTYNLNILYVIVGCFIPVVVSVCVQHIIQRIKRKLLKGEEKI